MKLALGTVQFGARYGAFNAGGQVSEQAVAAILDRAERAGVDTLDTARAYGESETVLGRLGAAKRFRIVTKIAALDGAGTEGVKRSFDASLAALDTAQVHGLMLHAADDLLGEQGDAIWQALEEIAASGAVQAIGVSVYTPDQLATLLDRYAIEIVQLPMSVFDRRFADAGLLDRLQAAHAEVHVRSAFLQGFALSDPGTLPPHLARWDTHLQHFIDTANSEGLSRTEAALGVVTSHPGVSRVLAGVDSLEQFNELIEAAHKIIPNRMKFDTVAITDEDLLNPSRWG